MVKACSQMEASIGSIKSLAAAVVAQGEMWKAEGYRSAAEKLASETGTTTGQAKRVLDLGRRMADQPEVAQQALAGKLSPDQAAVVAQGVEADPAKARDLIDRARRSSLGELNDEVARIKAAATDLEERRRRIHAARRLRFFKDLEGVFHTYVSGNPEDGAILSRAIGTIRRRLNVLSREAGRFETLEALDYDALMTLAKVAIGHDSPLDLTELVELGLFPQMGDGQAGSTAGCAPFAPPPAGSPEGPLVPPAVGPPEGPLAPPSAGPPEGPLVSPSSGPPEGPLAPNPAGSPEGPLVSPLAGPSEGPLAPPLFTADGDTDPPLVRPEPLVPAPRPHAPGPPAPPLRLDPAEPPPDVGHSDPAPAPGRPSTPPRRKKLAGSPVKVIVRVDLDTLLRGAPRAGELCEIVGYGAIAVSTVREMLANGNTIVTLALTRGQEIAGVYHHSRRPNAHQKTALELLYPLCAAEGCNARVGLQADHRKDWAKTHYTVFDLLDQLCVHHHNLKTRSNWALVEGTGKRPFVSPTDRRHPQHRPPQREAG